MTRTHTLTTLAADGLVASASTPGVVLCERDDTRETVIVSFNVWAASQSPNEIPGNGGKIELLLLFDDGDGPARTPSWARYTFVLRAGRDLMLSRTTPPLPSARISAALATLDGLDLADYRVQVSVAEFSRQC